ncbi:MAG: PhnB protein [Acidobacteriaceae bacterium]|jgi:PhnB protein
MEINPYVLFDGRCEEAFRFYERCLGGKIETMMPHEGTPAAEHTPANWLKKILHARLNVKGGILMGSDAPPGHYEKPQGFSVSLSLNDPKEAERIFHDLSEKATIHMPLAPTFWAERFGMLTDRFGIPWMINCEKKT